MLLLYSVATKAVDCPFHCTLHVCDAPHVVPPHDGADVYVAVVNTPLCSAMAFCTAGCVADATPPYASTESLNQRTLGVKSGEAVRRTRATSHCTYAVTLLAHACTALKHDVYWQSILAHTGYCVSHSDAHPADTAHASHVHASRARTFIACMGKEKKTMDQSKQKKTGACVHEDTEEQTGSKVHAQKHAKKPLHGLHCTARVVRHVTQSVLDRKR
jgi:hypothetical protein